MDGNIDMRNFGFRPIGRPLGFLIIARIEIIKTKSSTQLPHSSLMDECFCGFSLPVD